FLRPGPVLLLGSRRLRPRHRALRGRRRRPARVQPPLHHRVLRAGRGLRRAVRAGGAGSLRQGPGAPLHPHARGGAGGLGVLIGVDLRTSLSPLVSVASKSSEGRLECPRFPSRTPSTTITGPSSPGTRRSTGTPSS